ncbi:MAG: TonB-dependent receptor, partial [Bacteroidales bacterium]
FKSVVAFSGWHYLWEDGYNIGTIEDPVDYNWRSDVIEFTSKISVNLTRKFNARHKIRTGIVYDNTSYDSYLGWNSDTLYNRFINPDHPYHSDNLKYEHRYSDATGITGTLQAYLNWNCRITKNLTLNSGIHFLQFFLNNNYSVEPRIGVSWKLHPRHSINAGFGIHSRKESLSFYTGSLTLHDGTRINPNIELDLTKSQHYVLGYNYLISELLIAKLEGYYQYLFDIPVYPFSPYYSTINMDYGFEGNILVNRGTGHNMGIEFSVEKYFKGGYSFLVNGTIYESKFRNYRGEEYHTKYNGSFATAGLFMKEFQVGKNRQHTLRVGTRYMYTGGFRYVPVDLDASIANGFEILIYDRGFTEKASDFFRLDLQVVFRRNKPKYTGEWKLDILNVTNRKNMLKKKYNSQTEKIEIRYQNPIIPLLSYRIQF